MATRSEVLFYEEGYDEPIVFYQHWDGYELPHIVADALMFAEEHGRTTDTPYLGRIIFSEMLRHSSDETTGYGISFSRTEWTNYIVSVYSKYDSPPTISVNDRDGEITYSIDEFMEKYLKQYGAFNWKKEVAVEA
jgi:hypothetical protein